MDNSSIQASEDNNGGDNASNVSPLPKLSWTRRVEYILSKWADGASCFKWLHEQSYRKFKTRNNWFSIPVIILSTLTGALNVGMQGYVPAEYMGYAQIGVGSVNIFAGILTTLQSKFQYAEMSEAHFQAFIGWSRLARLISNELSLERNHRRNPNDLVKICKAEYERLMEQSPLVPSEVVLEFETRFGKRKEILFPDIADHLVHTEAYDDIKERKDRERNEKHFIVHKRETPPPMTDEQRMNAINKWKSLKYIVNAKAEASSVVQPNPPPESTPAPIDDDTPPPLLPKQSISARGPVQRPRPVYVPLPPATSFIPQSNQNTTPRTQEQGEEVRINVKDLANKFGGTISRTILGNMPQAPPPALSRRSSTSSMPTQRTSQTARSTSVHSIHSVRSNPSIMSLHASHTNELARSASVHSIHSVRSEPSIMSLHAPPTNESVHSAPPAESVHSDHPEDNDDVISNFTTFTEDMDNIDIEVHDENARTDEEEKRDE